MKKILVEGYFKNNFGDDLFLDILVNRYNNATFDFITPNFENIERFKGHPRVNIVSNRDVLRSNKKYFAFVTIGGSLFQEPKNWFKSWIVSFLKIVKLKKDKAKILLMGSNFGPYSNPMYLKLHGILFKMYDFISVRDEKSFNLIKKYNNKTQFNPDIVFMKSNSLSKFEKKSIIGISIMDFGIDKKNMLYKESMIRILKDIPSSIKIRLFSFQDTESISDLRIIKEVTEELNDKTNIEIINYDGNIESFTKKYAECHTFLTTRFHSMIMSILSKQNILAINYNEKVKNTVESLSLDIELLDLELFGNNHYNVAEKLIDLLEANEKSNYQLESISKEAIKNFGYLDVLLKGVV